MPTPASLRGNSPYPTSETHRMRAKRQTPARKVLVDTSRSVTKIAAQVALTTLQTP